MSPSDLAEAPPPLHVARPPAPDLLLEALRLRRLPRLHLDGTGADLDDPWSVAGLVALDARPAFRAAPGDPAEVARSLRRLDRTIAARSPGVAETGVAVLVGYEALAGIPRDPSAPGLPRLSVLEVDAALRFAADAGAPEGARLFARDLAARERAAALLDRLPAAPESGPAADLPATAVAAPEDALPRERYLDAVRRVHGHIRAGDIYQANVCRSLSVPVRGSAAAYRRRLAEESPAPFSAFWAEPDLAVVSISPERFVRVEPDGRIRTHPIKGTRRRSADPEEDRVLALELLASAKDRAELLMIVDLERNDLGRICRTGSVRVPELARLVRFPEVHHLVARVEGRLKRGWSPSALLRAIFPGGSITGAPKIRAMEILRGLEPARRGFFTGSLFWFGDDGHVDSSLLIRTAVFAGGRACIGAGGGIVADSDPEAEWEETNHKARALTRALGFEPEAAG